MIPLLVTARMSGRACVTAAAAGLTVALTPVAVTPSPMEHEVRAPLIAPTSFVGTPSAIATILVTPAAIVSTAQVPAPQVAAGPVEVAASAIAPTAVVFTPTLEVIAPQPVAAPTIPSENVVRSPAVAFEGAQQVAAPLIAGGSAVPAPAIMPGVVSVTPAMIGSTATVRSPAVAAGPASISPTLIVSTATVATPAVSGAAPTVDPEAGLTVTNSYPAGSSIAVSMTLRQQPVVCAAGIAFPATAYDTVIHEQGGTTLGLLVSINTTLNCLVFRTGDGSSASGTAHANKAEFTIPYSQVAGKSGRLVWECHPAAGRIRAWFQGVQLGSAVASGGYTVWGGNDTGGFLAIGGSQVPNNAPNTAPAYINTSPLSMYNNQVAAWV